MLKTNRTCQQF